MKIVRMNRRTGKSTELIKLSNEKWYYIICTTRQRAEYLVNQAEKIGLDIPFPITVAELPLKSSYIRGVIIDDVDDVLQMLIGKPPIVQSITSCEVEIREDPTDWCLTNMLD